MPKTPAGSAVSPAPDPHLAALSDEIERVAKAVQSLKSGRLTEKALYLLISHQAKVSASTVRVVLEAAARLDSTYLKPQKKA